MFCSCNASVDTLSSNDDVEAVYCSGYNNFRANPADAFVTYGYLALPTSPFVSFESIRFLPTCGLD